MANKYDYTDVEFCNRLALRKEIMQLHSQISGIAKATHYDYSFIFTAIMNCFYGRPYESNIDMYLQKLSPINTFNSNALILYKDYLTEIISHYYNGLSFREVIEKCGKAIRSYGASIRFLPEMGNDVSPLLPKSISGAMIKKADVTLSKSRLQSKDYEGNVLNTEKKEEPTSKYHLPTVEEMKEKLYEDKNLNLIHASSYTRPWDKIKNESEEFLSEQLTKEEYSIAHNHDDIALLTKLRKQTIKEYNEARDEYNVEKPYIGAIGAEMDAIDASVKLDAIEEIIKEKISSINESHETVQKINGVLDPVQSLK